MPQYKMEAVKTLNTAEFVRLWEEGKTAVLNNLPWHLFQMEDASEQQKMIKFHGLFLRYLVEPDKVVWRSELNGRAVALNAGTLDPKTMKIIWELSVIGFDENGERSWFTIPEATAARNAFWDSVGVQGWTMKVFDSENNTISRFFREIGSTPGDSLEIRAAAESADPLLDKMIDIDVTKN